MVLKKTIIEKKTLTAMGHQGALYFQFIAMEYIHYPGCFAEKPVLSAGEDLCLFCLSAHCRTSTQ